MKSHSDNKLEDDMLGSCVRIVTAEINVGILEFVQKMAFIQYSPLIML